MANTIGKTGDSKFLISASRYWNESYAADHVGLVLLLMGYLMLVFFATPFHRMFSLDDVRIAFPYANVERVPLTLDVACALFLPLLLLPTINFFTRASAHKHHVSILGLLIALATAAFLTDIVKNTVGRPRPDLLARCKAPATAPRGPAVLVSWEICTEDRHHVLHDGWRSFPSGHSSFAFAGLGYLALWLAGQMRVFAEGKGDVQDGQEGSHVEKLVRGDLLRALFCAAPLLGAVLIAISRCMDYRHDVYDVCAGSLLGWLAAYWSYRRYWPRLGSARPDVQYCGPPSVGAARKGVGTYGYGRVRDEEDGMGCAGAVGEEGNSENVGFEMRNFSER